MLKSFKGNPKRFFGYIRSKQTVKTKVAALKKSNGDLTQTDEEVAEVLCEHFQSVFVDETAYDSTGSEADEDGATEGGAAMGSMDVRFTVDVIREKLIKLQENKSPGPDGIHPMILKQCAEELALPLSIIFQESFDTAQLPSDWKSANISSIYKKGSKQEASNYRPVSLTSVLCKVMESILKDHVTEFLLEKQWLSTSQHGFMAGRSCLTNLLEAFEAWTRLLDEGHGIDVIFLDYKKAFDTVPHKRLLVKLKQLGLPVKVIAWIRDFLTGRQMRVMMQGSFSDWVRVISGVPQGSVLGPLLFLIFVNDLPQWVTNSMKMFADDTKIWTVIDGPEDSKRLQEDLDTLMKWSQSWLLKFNPEKCKVMHIGHTYPTQYVMIDNGIQCMLGETTEEKDLGVTVTSDLKPGRQCTLSAKKAMSVLGLIKRTFKRIDADDFKILYNCYVRPHLEYCIQAWCPYLVKDIQCLERVQRRATKLVVGMKHLPYQDRLSRLGIYSLDKRRLRGDLIEMYKLLSGKENVDYSQFFQLAPSSYNLRGHSQKLFVQRSRLNCRKFFFSQRSVNEWNRLPAEIVEAPSVNSFKNRLDKTWTDVGT